MPSEQRPVTTALPPAEARSADPLPDSAIRSVEATAVSGHPAVTPAQLKAITDRLGSRSLVLVGLMGCGKSTVGRRLATRLGLRFVDADEEIEAAANKSIPEIFAEHGEPYFRAGERRVIARLLRNGPQVLATGGGAFMDADTRAAIAAQGVSVWLKAEIPLLMRRVARRSNRPLLQASDPETVLRTLMERRHPIYALADLTVESRDISHDAMTDIVLSAMLARGTF